MNDAVTFKLMPNTGEENSICIVEQKGSAHMKYTKLTSEKQSIAKFIGFSC